jgi:hypothetical protein
LRLANQALATLAVSLKMDITKPNNADRLNSYFDNATPTYT